MRIIVAVVAAVSSLAACAAPYRSYGGVERPASEVAVIEQKELLVGSVDGAQVPDQVHIDRNPIQVLPGERKVRLVWTLSTSPNKGLAIYPRGNLYYRRAPREGVMTKYRRYYKDVKVELRAGRTYEAVWTVVEGQKLREPSVRAKG